MNAAADMLDEAPADLSNIDDGVLIDQQDDDTAGNQ